MSSDEVIKRLKGHYSKYTKNCNMYLIIMDKTKDACDKAKKLEKYHRDNNRDIQSVEDNPQNITSNIQKNSIFLVYISTFSR